MGGDVIVNTWFVIVYKGAAYGPFEDRQVAVAWGDKYCGNYAILPYRLPSDVPRGTLAVTV